MMIWETMMEKKSILMTMMMKNGWKERTKKGERSIVAIIFQ